MEKRSNKPEENSRETSGENRNQRSRGKSDSDKRGNYGDRRKQDRPYRKKDEEGKRPYSRGRKNDDRPYRGKRKQEGDRDNKNQSFGKEKPRFSKDKRKGDRFDKSRGKRSYTKGKKKFDQGERSSKFFKTAKGGKHPISFETEVRLNRFIANSGICSRREADNYIQAGFVSINGEVVKEMGVKVKPKDEVRFRGKPINFEKPVYILMNKPKDFITTRSDEKDRKTVLDLLGTKVKERVYPVGRLDKDTTGLLLLTNDGDLTKKLTHPSYEVKKVYHIKLHKEVTEEDLQKLNDGFELTDGFIKADVADYADGAEDKRRIGIEIHSGRNRIIRRMMEHLGYRVVTLDRVSMNGLTKKRVPRGKWRYLNDKEVAFLKRNSS